MSAKTVSRGDIALSYVVRGWHAFPVNYIVNGQCSCGKGSDCASPGKHPLTKNGFQDATDDPEIIKAWWRENPSANIAIATGEVSGLAVLDVDNKNGGFSNLDLLQEECDGFPETLTVKTGSGGTHYFFKRPSDGFRTTNNVIASGLDTRGDGGYIVAVGSNHISGGSYEWLDCEPGEIELAEVPPLILEKLNAGKIKEEKVSSNGTGKIPEGERNSALTSIAGKLRHADFDTEMIADSLLAMNAKQCNPPLDEKEILSIAESVGSYAIQEPQPLRRQVPEGEEYPMDSLGSILGGAAEMIHAGVQSPKAMCAQSILAGASLAVQGFADVEIDGRVFPVSEFFLTVALSGDRKTTTDKAALSPHAKRQKSLRDSYLAERTEFSAEHVAWKKEREETLAGAKEKSQSQKKEMVLKVGPEPEPPINAILTMEEPTYEGIVKALDTGWPSVGIFSDEAARFLHGFAMNAENQVKTISGLSKLWDGTPIRRTRAGDGNILLFGRRVSLHLMLQPAVSSVLFCNPMMTGQGFLSRCLVSDPVSTIGDRPYKNLNVHETDEYKRYFARMMNILEEPLPLYEEVRNELTPRILPLSSSAKGTFVQFYNHIEKLSKKGKELSAISGFAAKSAEHAARLAGILALVDDLEIAEISSNHIEAGIELTQFYISEALRLFDSSVIDPDLILAERLLSWAQGRGENIYPQLVYQYGPSEIRDKATAERIIKVLVSHGWFKPISGGATVDGIKRNVIFEVVR